MDGELLRRLYPELFHCATARRPHRCSYSDSIVVFLYLLSVMADRSMRWAHQKRNWPLWAQHLHAPSYSQMMRGREPRRWVIASNE